MYHKLPIFCLTFSKAFLFQFHSDLLRGKSDLRKFSSVGILSEEFAYSLRHSPNPIEVTGPSQSCFLHHWHFCLGFSCTGQDCQVILPQVHGGPVGSPLLLHWSLWVAALPLCTLAASLTATSSWYFSKPEGVKLGLGFGKMLLPLCVPTVGKE